jgi:hypothetical protein
VTVALTDADFQWKMNNVLEDPAERPEPLPTSVPPVILARVCGPGSSSGEVGMGRLLLKAYAALGA